MLPLQRIYRGYRNIGRLQEIVNVFARHGFGRLIERLHLHHKLPFGRAEVLVRRLALSDDEEEASVARRLRLAFEELGPTFVKMGQVMATRQDLFPPEVIRELSRLNENVPPLPFSAIASMIAEELGGPVDEVFQEFEEESFAAASIAQVHRARLWSGEEVVVKVQRPHIAVQIEKDLAILFNLAQLLERYIEDMRRYEPLGLVTEFSRSIRKELDFGLEGANAEQMGRNFQRDSRIVIPRVYWEFTTRRILTMERLVGVPLDRVETLRAQGHDLPALARLGGRAFLRMVLDHGFFHADPHPGNVLAVGLRPERIGLLDFGMMGRLGPAMVDALATLVLGLLQRDYESVVLALGELGSFTEETDVKNFQRDLADFIEPLWGRDLSQIEFGQVLNKSIELSLEYKTRLPPDLLMLSKALVTIEGVGRRLDPHLNLVELGRPFAVKIIARRYDPVRLGREAVKTGLDLLAVSREVPLHVRTSFERLLGDRLGVRFLHEGLEGLEREIERAATKLTAGLLASALVLGASWVLAASVGPIWKGIPVLGAVGYSIAGLYAMWVVLSLLRGR